MIIQITSEPAELDQLADGEAKRPSADGHQVLLDHQEYKNPGHLKSKQNFTVVIEDSAIDL